MYTVGEVGGGNTRLRLLIGRAAGGCSATNGGQVSDGVLLAADAVVDAVRRDGVDAALRGLLVKLQQALLTVENGVELLLRIECVEFLHQRGRDARLDGCQLFGRETGVVDGVFVLPLRSVELVAVDGLNLVGRSICRRHLHKAVVVVAGLADGGEQCGSSLGSGGRSGQMKVDDEVVVAEELACAGGNAGVDKVLVGKLVRRACLCRYDGFQVADAEGVDLLCGLGTCFFSQDGGIDG